MRSLLLLLFACNPDPGELDETVGYRDGLDGGPTSGERGNVVIAEILWSGSVNAQGVWDPTDVFVEIHNQGNKPVNISSWRLVLSGDVETTWVLPATDRRLEVGDRAVVAHKNTGCFPEADFIVAGMAFPFGDPFELTLLDADERLMEPSGSEHMPPFAGGYDLVASRSMERINLMFGANGGQPEIWKYYAESGAPDDGSEDPEMLGVYSVDGNPNNDLVKKECRRYTLASPGRANSPDYSGSYASGSFE